MINLNGINEIKINQSNETNRRKNTFVMMFIQFFELIFYFHFLFLCLCSTCKIKLHDTHIADKANAEFFGIG